MLRNFKSKYPKVGIGSYIDEQALLIGEVTIGEESSIWPFVSIRGDVNSITIGNRTSIQDGSVLHVTHKTSDNPAGFPLNIGDDVTVGHKALLHGCTIGDRVLVGMGAVVMDGVVIANDVLIAAGSLIPPNKILESGYLYQGSPAKQIRKLNEQDLNFLKYSAQTYVELIDSYIKQKK